MKPAVTTLLLLLLIGACADATAQEAVEIFPAGKNVVVATRNVSYVKSLHPLAPDSFRKDPGPTTFRPLPQRSVFFSGWDPYYYWFRFVLVNRDTVPKNIFLLMGPIGHRSAVLYRADFGVWREEGRTGNRFRFEERPYPHIHTAYPIELAPRTQDTFYMNMDYGSNYKTFGFAFVSPRKMHQLESKVYFVFGTMIGILLLFAVFNIYLFFSLKDRLHAWYAAYIGMLLFLLLKYEGFDEQFFPLDSELANRLTPIMGIGAFTIFLLMHVVQIFLTNIPASGVLYRITKALKYNLLLSGLAHVVFYYLQTGYRSEEIVFEYANKSTFAGILMILVNCIVSYVRGFRPALFLLLGTIVFLIGGLEKIFFVDSTSYLFPPSLFEYGMVIEACIISFGLMYRYNLFKKEKDRLNEALSQQHALAATQVLEAQETERKRIAEDLHDELGSSLAALKLRLQKTGLPSAELNDVIAIVDKASSDTRGIAHNLMPPEFEQTSLGELLGHYYKRLHNETGVRFEFLVSGSHPAFTKFEELVIYRIIMELTSNILRHSGATEASVQLIYYEDHLEIMAEDNGRGMNQAGHGGIGLKNIHSRVQYIQGELLIDSGAHGTTVMIRIPFKKSPYDQ